LSWSVRDIPGITEQAFNEARQAKPAQIEEKNLKVRSWADAYLLMVGAIQYKDDKAMLKALASQITNQTKVSLAGTNRLIIWERITSGEILFEGKGFQVSDDLFTVAGRANWALRNLTQKNFGYVKPNSTAEDLAQLQKKWTRFLIGEQVEEYQNPFPYAEKGLSEIRSREALEALITSIKPGKEKDKLTKDCLQRIYKMDELPKEENSPAAMCSPDTMTHRYLAVLTGVKDKQNYDWWKTWWETNQNRLEWNKEKGTFEVKK
ncbi:MAG TPA: hypothetical protein VK400_12680, partial [Pyrinomonadaceae bacterium]|nr:hypothetical protein [Pyrinomonadaceae bacterium]